MIEHAHHHAKGIYNLMAHKTCLIQEPWIVYGMSITDLLTFIAYMVIGIICYNHKLVKIGAFVFACGIGHLMKLITMYTGGVWYVMEFSSGLVTAFLSIIVATQFSAIAKKLSKK